MNNGVIVSVEGTNILYKATSFSVDKIGTLYLFNQTEEGGEIIAAYSPGAWDVAIIDRSNLKVVK